MLGKVNCIERAATATSNATVNGISRLVQINQVRFKGSRSVAYPARGMRFRTYSPSERKYKSLMRLQMKDWLGPKNYKGEYLHNIYYAPPKHHQPNYINDRLGANVLLKKDKKGNIVSDPRESDGRKPSFNRSNLSPFPNNPATVTNKVIEESLKETVINDMKRGISLMDISINTGIKIPRLQGLLKLDEIERKWRDEKRITRELEILDNTMYEMFPVFSLDSVSKTSFADDQISADPKARAGRFLTIAESEPFGPLDAANELNIEPAADILAKSKDFTYISEKAAKEKENRARIFIAPQLKGEKSLLRFTHARVGHVGFRYGASKDDNKRNRKVKFNEIGEMVYA